MAMVIYLGADHGGFELKEKIKRLLASMNLHFEDLGTHTPDSVDYPEYGANVAKAVAKKKDACGIAVCGTGIGICMAANKVPGARATLAYNNESAKMSKEHNNSNILCLGGRTMEHDAALEMVKIWLTTPYSNEDRHNRRLREIAELEK